MKKLIFIFIILTGIMVAQEENTYNYFDKGTISCGTLFSYQSYDSGSPTYELNSQCLCVSYSS